MHFPASFVLLAIIATLAKACITDAVMRSLSEYQYSASAFCTQYIRPTVSETVIITTTLTTTDVTIKPPPITVIATKTTIQTWTLQVAATSTTSLYPSPIKRELEARSIFIPPYLSNFAPYQLSSGCSCFITPLPTPVSTIVAETIITTYLHATTTAPPATITTYTTLTLSTTTTQTLTTVVPNCFPINGCILPNSSYANVAWESDQGPLFCQYYCEGIGGCLSYQMGPGPTCNFLGIAGWRAWDPSPGPEVAPGVGGGDCEDYWIYERGCGYISGYPAL